MIIQTGEKDTSLEPYYSLINRQTEGRLLADVASAKACSFTKTNTSFLEKVYIGRVTARAFTRSLKVSQRWPSMPTNPCSRSVCRAEASTL